MPMIDRSQKAPLPAASAGLLMQPPVADPSGMGSSVPSPQGEQVPNWLHNVLSALDQSLTTGFPGMQGAGPPKDPRAEIMIPLMMLAMAAEPGPDMAKTLEPFIAGIKKLPIDKLIDLGDNLQMNIVNQDAGPILQKLQSGRPAPLNSSPVTRLQEQLIDREMLERALVNSADRPQAIAAGWDTDIASGDINAIQAMLAKLGESIRQGILFSDAAP